MTWIPHYKGFLMAAKTIKRATHLQDLFAYPL